MVTPSKGSVVLLQFPFSDLSQSVPLHAVLGENYLDNQRGWKKAYQVNQGSGRLNGWRRDDRRADKNAAEGILCEGAASEQECLFAAIGLEAQTHSGRTLGTFDR